MSNVLRVTTPLTGYDNNLSQQRTDAANRAPDAKVQGPALPNQVVRPDGRSDAAQEHNIAMKFQYQSNFEGFLSQVRDNGAVTEEFATALFERLSTIVKSGMGENTAQEIARFLSMIQVDPQNMLSFVKEQGDTANRFQGAFFSLLRQAMNETQNVELRAGILEFAKRFTDMAEGNHLLKQIQQTMEQIKSGMFESGRERMEQMEQEMNFSRLAATQDEDGFQSLDALMKASGALTEASDDLTASDALMKASGTLTEASDDLTEADALMEASGTLTEASDDLAEADALMKASGTLTEASGALMGEPGALMEASGGERAEALLRNALAAADEMPPYAEPGEALDNAAVVKEKILPYLNQYIGKTHDRGNVRENAAFLAALTARYENGDTSRVMSKFEELMEYSIMKKYFKGFGSEDLMHALENTDFEKAVKKNNWMKEFADLIEDGVSKGNSIEQKMAFRNMMTSMLLNESVYMPVLHMMLPMQMDDKLMFAEMWIDPDAGREEETEEKERAVQGLIKFDIQDLGFFDLFFVYQGGGVNLQLNYPEVLSKKEDEIRDGITDILTRNGLEAKELYLGSSKESIALSDAFPQIFERRNTVNVTA